MKILITGVGGPTARSVAFALKSCSGGTKYKLIGTDCNRLSIGLYQDSLFKKTYIIPIASDPNYWTVIEKIIHEEKIDITIVQPEQEVLEWSRRAKAEDLPCKSLIPDFNLARISIDKSLVNELLAPFGFVPQSVIIEKNKYSFDEVKKRLGCPFWIRSTLGSSGSGSLEIESNQKLESWLLIKGEIKKFIASKYLPGRNLACKLLYFNGELIRSACAERVNYIMPNASPSGITGNTSFGRLLNEFSVFKTAKEGLEVLFEKTGAKKHGLFTVDLKEDEKGKPLITEVNVRHIAFTACFALAGANLVEDSIRLLCGDSTFDRKFKLYEFKDNPVFFRGVDSLPFVLKESQLF